MFDGLLDYLKENLPQKIIDGGYSSYEIFGKEAEIPISDTIEEYLETQEISYSAHRSENKNEFPDLELTIGDQKYALEHKAGASDIKGSKKNKPANDMGTLNAYPEKITKYGDNIFCTFVKYSVQSDDTIKIEDIYFDKIYKFIGLGKGFTNQLQYREKDGNLRPKSWADMRAAKSYVSSLDEFRDSLDATSKYRSERIAKKHLKNLEKDTLICIRDYINDILGEHE